MGGSSRGNQHARAPSLHATTTRCADAGLCIEVDGDTHAKPGQPEYDAARAAWLGQLGSRVIRFTNADAFGNLAGVLETIRSECQEERAKGTT